MPYSTAQLTQYYTLVNRGQAPGSATQSTLSTLAQLNQAGSQSDATALAVTTRTAQTVATTDVLLATYQFFTGAAPSSAGLDYLVNTPGSGFNTSYFNGVGAGPNGQPASATNIGAGGFNLENRYYNEAVALVSNPVSGAAFAATYGSLSISQTIQAAYATIVGASEVGAAQVQAATASIATSLAYFQQIANERAGGVDVGGQPGQNIALKAVIIGYVLEEALKADVGLYARAIDNFNAATALGTAVFNQNLLTAYGVGSANDLGAAIIYNTAGNAVNTTTSNLSFRATSAADTLTISGADISGVTVDLGAGNDMLLGTTSNGVVAMAGSPTTLLAGDGNDTIGRPIAPLLLFAGQSTGPVTLDGGAGTDTLNLFAATNIDSTVSITGFETVNIQTSTNAPQRIVDGSRITGATALTHQGATGLQGDLQVDNVAPGTALTAASTGASVFTFASSSPNPTVNLVGSTVGVVTVSNASGTLTLSHATDVTALRIFSGAPNFTDSSTAAFSTSYLGFQDATYTASHVVDLTSVSSASFFYITRAQGQGTSETLKLSAGADVLKLAFSSTSSIAITTGAGSDAIYVADVIGAQSGYVDGSGGTRAFGNIGFLLGQVATFTTITDFTKGSDHLNVELGTGVYTNTIASNGYANAVNLTAAVNNAESLMGTGGTTVFEYAGSTYIFQDDGSGALGAGDVLIKLTGVVGLSVGGLNTSDIHFG